MVRSTQQLAICFLTCVLVFVCGESRAQQLARLHVDALGMHADRTVAPVAGAIHVTIHVHVREQISNLDDLVLPDLANLQILGDERRMHQDASGTDYVETLTVTGLQPGIAHLTPAHLDAIDARNGRPSRFSSNDLTIRIEPEGTAVNRTDWRSLAWRALLIAGGIVAGLAVLIALIRMRYVRARQPARDGPPAAALALPRLEPRPALERALVSLRSRRTRDEAFATRFALRSFAGARGDETLDLLLVRLDGSVPALRAALRLAERAAFGDESRLQSGIDELIPAVERVLAQ